MVGIPNSTGGIIIFSILAIVLFFGAKKFLEDKI